MYHNNFIYGQIMFQIHLNIAFFLSAFVQYFLFVCVAKALNKKSYRLTIYSNFNFDIAF